MRFVVRAIAPLSALKRWRGVRPFARPRSERGQILMLVAVLLAVLLGLTGIVIDLGIAYRSVGDAQNDADAIALAAARELQLDGSVDDARNAARQWATSNGVDLSDLDCCRFEDLRPLGNPDGVLDTVSVTVNGASKTYFMPALGIDSVSVERSATAQVVHAHGAKICPWGLLGDPTAGDTYGVEPGRIYVLKVNQDAVDRGNFRALDLGITGANGYRDYIRSGCSGASAAIWKEGDDVLTQTQPGDLGQSTRNALNDYYAYELSDGIADPQGWAWCDVAFDRDPAALEDGTAEIYGYNPYLDGPREGCSHDTLPGNGRIVNVPVIDGLPNGSGSVEILGIASMYIAAWDRTGPPSRTQVYGLFLEEAPYSPQDVVGASDNPLAPLHIVLIK